MERFLKSVVTVTYNTSLQRLEINPLILSRCSKRCSLSTLRDHTTYLFYLRVIKKTKIRVHHFYF